MRKILFILLLAPFALKSQTVNTFRDSTWFKRGVRFDSTLVFSKGAGVGKVWTSNANGTGSWQTFSSAGVTQGALDDSISAVRAIRKVDTLYRNLDSIVFKINGLRYSIKDSTGTVGATVSSYGKNTGKDSTILVLSDGTRYSAKDSIANLTGYALQVSLNDTANVLRGLIPSVSSYATITNLADTSSLLRGLINTKGTGTVTSVATDATLTGGTITTSGTLKVDTTVVSTKANVTGLLLAKANQSALNDSVNTLRNIRKQDTSYFALNATRDSLVYTKVINGTLYRTPVRDSTGGGGASLSGLTAATATNTINNVANTQEWQWNSLTSGTGLKLSSNSTGAASNTQSILSIAQSGTNSNANQTTYGLEVINSKAGVNGTHSAGKFWAIGTGSNSENVALSLKGKINMDYVENSITGIYAYQGAGITWTGSGQYCNIYSPPGGAEFRMYASSEHGLRLYTANNGTPSVGSQVIQLRGSNTANYSSIKFNSLNATAYATNAADIRLQSGKMIFYVDNTTANASYTETARMTIDATNANVGIGTTTPVASAILDLTSTTKGFKPPVMTATQASAIASPAKSLMLYVTDTNGTFTSAGLWIYTTSWKLIIAE